MRRLQGQFKTGFVEIQSGWQKMGDKTIFDRVVVRFLKIVTHICSADLRLTARRVGLF